MVVQQKMVSIHCFHLIQVSSLFFSREEEHFCGISLLVWLILEKIRCGKNGQRFMKQMVTTMLIYAFNLQKATRLQIFNLFSSKKMSFSHQEELVGIPHTWLRLTTFPLSNTHT